jgi:hypothetical protein
VTAPAEAPVLDATERLVAAFETERRLLEGLCDALAMQRAGIAADDAGAIESANQGVARAILTLEEARRRREQLVQVTPLPRLQLVGGHPGYDDSPSEVQVARAALRATARVTVQTLTVNQAILRGALRAGDRYVQALFASASEPLPAYADPHGVPAPAQRGVVVNRSA